MDIKDVENLANLARIELDEDEKKELLSDMKGILDYVKVIEKIPARDATHSVAGGEVSTATESEEYSLKNVWREDLPGKGEFSHELIMKQFPDVQDSFLKVKKIL